jgi:class 3 adenylate cyclase
MNSSESGTKVLKQKLARQCVICGTILEGLLSYIFRIAGIKRSLHNPNLCNRCNTHVEDGSIVKISVLFADISSFTEKTHELGPEQIHEVTDAFLQMATNALVAHDAYVDKYIGDAVMAFFNMPIQRDDHAEQAVAAALEINAGISQLRERFALDLKTGTGIATGWARVGRLGSKYREDYTAIGDVVNMAARLEGQAQPGEILIHSEVYEKVASDFPDSPSESLWLKGFPEPVLTYYLYSAADRPQHTYSGRPSHAATSRVALGAVIFALLGAPCVAFVLIGPLATSIGIGVLFGAVLSHWMFFDAAMIRIPLLVVATIGSLAMLYTVWRAKRLRQKTMASEESDAITRRERFRPLAVIGLAVTTMIVVALSVAVHDFHFLMH